jgi:DNA-binding beta-propeller fold protein YncE
MKVKLLFLSLISTVFFIACGEKEPCCTLPTADYSKGIFVVNEGPFGGTGTISWYNPDTGETQDSLFEKANKGAVLGQFVQSLTFFKGKGYIVVNGANSVVVVDATTFQYLDTIGGLALPRYFLPLNNNTAYISQWGLDGLTGSVVKVDLGTNKVIKTIPAGLGPEKMVLATDRVYVANSGGYGKDSTLTEIMLGDDSAQILPIVAGINPATLVLNNYETPVKLVCLCKGYFGDPTPAGRLDFLLPGTPGVEAPAYSDDLMLDGDSGDLFFIGDGKVYKFSGTGPAASRSILFSQAAYGLGYDADQNLLYCADAKGFTGLGEVVIYQTDGTKLGSFRTGIAPGEVIIVK